MTKFNRHKWSNAVLAVSRLGLQMTIALQNAGITTIMQHILPYINYINRVNNNIIVKKSY